MNRGGIAYLPMLITFLLCKESHEPSFSEETVFLVLLKKARFKCILPGNSSVLAWRYCTG